MDSIVHHPSIYVHDTWFHVTQSVSSNRQHMQYNIYAFPNSIPLSQGRARGICEIPVKKDERLFFINRFSFVELRNTGRLSSIAIAIMYPFQLPIYPCQIRYPQIPIKPLSKSNPNPIISYCTFTVEAYGWIGSFDSCFESVSLASRSRSIVVFGPLNRSRNMAKSTIR